MQKNHTHAVLNKLISLTRERDLVSLEYLLAKSICELIAPDNTEVVNAVKIYHAKNLDKQIFATTDSDRNAHGEQLPQALKDVLTVAFISCENCVYTNNGQPDVNIYPLTNSQHEVIAVIAIEAIIQDDALSNTIALVLQVYQNFAGIIRDNEHDTLTGLLNRKTFEYKLNKILTAMHKTKMRQDDKPNSSYFLALFDIDHFKKINDVYGHLIGDEVLLTFSKMMQQTFREKDMLFRYGGEEFVAVFECANKADIALVLERFRTKIANFTFPKVGDVKVSIGYTQIQSSDATLQIVDRADQALYYAKKNGRNQIRDFEALVKAGAFDNSKKEEAVA